MLGHTAPLYQALAFFYLQKTLNLCLCICSKFTLSTEYLSTVLLCKVPAAGDSLWGMASTPYFAWPCSFLSVSLSCERSVFFGQLPLFSACILMIGGIFQTPLLEGGEVTTSLGLTLKELHGNVVTMSKSFWGKKHPGDRSLTQALGMRMMRAAGKSGFF